MSNRKSSVILIVLLSLLILFFLGVLVQGLTNNGGNKKVKLMSENEYSLSEFNKINISTTSSDIKIMHSDDEKVKVKVYATDDDKVVNEVKDNELNVSIKAKNRFNFCFFCFVKGNKRMEIYLPKEYAGSFDVKLTSGDLKAASYPNAKLKARFTSGDLEINSIKDATIRLTSGDVKINKINNYAHIKATSGDIKIDKFNINKDSYIKITSGDVVIKETSDAYINAKVTSGDIDINNSNRKAEHELKIKATSGDISVN